MQTTFAQTRILRAEQISPTVRVQNPITRTFCVPSQSDGDKTYTVNLTLGHCTCPDHQYRGVACKHILAAQRAESKPQRVVVITTRYRTYAELFAALKI